MLEEVIFDIEADNLLPGLTMAHCMVLRDAITDEIYAYHDSKEFTPRAGSIEDGLTVLTCAERIIGHNISGYDIPALGMLYGWKPSEFTECYDTLTIARGLMPDTKPKDFPLFSKNRMPGQCIGAHSLKAWGHRLTQQKDEYTGGFEEFSQEMLDYCIQDTQVTDSLYRWCLSFGLPWATLKREVDFRAYLEKQQEYGVPFDRDQAHQVQLDMEAHQLKVALQLDELVDHFHIVYFTKIRKIRKEKDRAVKYGSQDDIAKHLIERRGWKPHKDEYSAKTGKPSVTGDILSLLPWPEADLFKEYLTITDRLGTLRSLIKKVRPDGRVKAVAIHNGTVTHRCTHREVVNIPKPGVPWAEAFRGLFYAPKGWTMVGADAKALELMCLGHYLTPYDGGAYSKAVVEGDKLNRTDPHSLTWLRVPGINDRDEAKTFTYALMYGGGNGLLGDAVGGSRTTGKNLKAAFYKATPGFSALMDALAKAIVAHKGVLRAIDGRPLFVRHKHAVLNMILQSCGALLMKEFTVLMWRMLEDAGLIMGLDWTPAVHSHDEAQLLVLDGHVEKVSSILKEAMNECGKAFDFRLLMEADVQSGRTWAETH
jgi:DNA polymerase-1